MQVSKYVIVCSRPGDGLA